MNEYILKKVKKIILLLQKNNKTVGTAESLTAGMISSFIAGVSGSSSVLNGGIVSYHLSVKEKVLNIPKDILKEDAVNKETAELMAKNTTSVLNCDYGLSATGIAESYDERGQIAYCSIYDRKNNISHPLFFQFQKSDRNQVREEVALLILSEFLYILEDNLHKV